MDFQIIIPMSGVGQRFLNAGYTTPKPLIEVDGEEMIAHVLRMFPGEKDIKFICNKRHLAETALTETLNRLGPEGEIYGIDEHKLGPVYAVSKIFDSIDDDKPTIISYCDYFAKWDYHHFKQQVLAGGYAGCIPCYKGFHPHLLMPNLYAGVLADAHNELIEIREKCAFNQDKMQIWQSSGAYYFASGRLAKKYCQMAMDERLTCNSEYYVSLVYNLLKRDSLKTLVYPQSYFCQWGTPEDLQVYQRWSAYFASLAKKPGTRVEAAPVMTNLVPLAGEGLRFAEAGYTQPKPLIEVDGCPMIIQAVAHLPQASKHVFLCRADHIRDYQIDAILKKSFPDATVIPIAELTEGQASTCALGREAVAPHKAMTIGACDNGMIYDHQLFAGLMARPDIDAVIWTFKNHAEVTAKPEMYGWVEVDSELMALKVHCKKPISATPQKDHAVVGVFSFKKADAFFTAYERAVLDNRRIRGEFYVDEVMNVMIEAGKRVAVFPVDTYLGWGTPELLKTFAYWQRYFAESPLHEYGLARGAAA